MPWFLEHSGPILLAGILLEVVLGSLLVRSGRGIWLWPMLGVLLLTCIGVALERWIQTPKEQVASTLYAAASALEENNVDRLFEHISPTAQYTPHRARSALQLYRFRQARITHLEIEINQLTSPPTAVAYLVGLISVEDKQSQPIYTGRVQLEVLLRWEKDRWRITGHQELHFPRDW
ncbi:MAG: hypothetical protein NZ602_14005 [Thermoguttaceae bacterium]|nr:hypothetical protein [Thermoguttaceae bacterium]MDW8039419.1 hypothetical protein [Thermoguttaceae bacterium]